MFARLIVTSAASRLFWQKIAEAYPSVCTLKKDSK